MMGMWVVKNDQCIDTELTRSPRENISNSNSDETCESSATTNCIDSELTWSPSEIFPNSTTMGGSKSPTATSSIDPEPTVARTKFYSNSTEQRRRSLHHKMLNMVKCRSGLVGWFKPWEKTILVAVDLSFQFTIIHINIHIVWPCCSTNDVNPDWQSQQQHPTYQTSNDLNQPIRMQPEPQEMEPTMDGQKKDSEKRCQIWWTRKRIRKKVSDLMDKKKIRLTKQMKKWDK